ncbi:MAG: hypothetical protein HY973_03630, partial [Candidatus Kerfeldbacteria bacterium]|nr:hypothetical protein [Candidatus Kerfeldbacteria bacterium]
RGAGSVSKIDITNNTVQHFGGVSGPYGIGIDQQDNVWVASWEGQSIYKINGQTGGIIFNKPLGMNARGVAVDAYGNVWVSHSLNDKVTKLDNNGNVLFTVNSDPDNATGYIGAHPIGITATAEGFIWVVNYNTHRAVKLHPDNGSILAWVDVGLNHYTYSDMAGYALRSITLRSGSWTVNFDSKADNSVWKSLSWVESEPAGTYVKVRARSAASQSGLTTAAWSPYYDSPPANISGLPNNRWIQIEVSMHTNLDSVSPGIKDLKVEFE